LTKDSVDFVRQGAFIALGMILVEQSEASSPSIVPTRAKYTKVISDKHEDPMARFGAAIGQGFIDAGGRNVTISLQSRAGSTNTNAIVGMVMFCQFWYWYPLAHCACLAFSPTGIIGLNDDLKVSVIVLFSPFQAHMFNSRPLNSTTFQTPNRVCLPTLCQHNHPKRRLSPKLQPLSCRQPLRSKQEKRRRLQLRVTAWIW